MTQILEEPTMEQIISQSIGIGENMPRLFARADVREL
jgi:hypothetical protein